MFKERDDKTEGSTCDKAQVLPSSLLLGEGGFARQRVSGQVLDFSWVSK